MRARYMTPPDLDQVVAMEAKANEYHDEDMDCTAVLTCAWNEIDFRTHMQSRAGAALVLADRNEKVHGFAAYENYPESVVLYRFVVTEWKYANALMDALVLLGKPMTFVINEHDTKMHLFLKERGFRAVEVIDVGGMDVYKFQFELKGKVKEKAV